MWYKSKLAIIGYIVVVILLIGSLSGSDKSSKISNIQVDSADINGTTTSEFVSSTTEQSTTPGNDSKIEPSADNVLPLYKVIKVVDGDTITVSINGKSETLRLIGINTPETVDPRKPVECFGKEASDRAKAVLSGQQVKLEADPSQGERDKYSRLLRYVFLPDGTFFNKLMIQEGYAYEYTYNTPYKYQTEFKQAEQEAKLAKRGLWADNACQNTSNPAQTTTTVMPPNNGQYICSYNAYNCSDFSTQAEAQDAFESCGGTSNDIHQLDRDGDGKVCESLK